MSSGGISPLLETRLMEALKFRSCGRFDVTPCRERPEIREEKWCSWCRLAEAWDSYVWESA